MLAQRATRPLAATVLLSAALLTALFGLRWVWVSRFALGRVFWTVSEDFRYFSLREWDTMAHYYLFALVLTVPLVGGVLTLAARRGYLLRARADLLKRAFRRYRDLAESDALTGLATRRGVLQGLENEIKRAARYRAPLCTLFIDVDNFKAINDTLGHGAGDTVLRTIAESIKTTVRETDTAGRYGGDEFLVVLPHASAAQGCQVAERVRTRVAALFADRRDVRTPPTISIGVMAYAAAVGGLAAYLDAADKALLKSKSLGKNRTILCENPGIFRSITPPAT
jgi:diguanylate cyclase (GGDEF)-like protein